MDSNGCFPFRACLECFQGPSLTATQSYAQLREELLPTVKLDKNHTGKSVVLLKEDTRICGSGGVLGNVPLLQNKSYFEVHVTQSGVWAMGIGTRKAELSSVPNEHGLVLRQDGAICANGELVAALDRPIEEESIGIAFDHEELKFYVGEHSIAVPVGTAFRGQVFYPLLFVNENAILDVRFNNFALKPPPGHTEIIVEQTLL